NKYHFYIHAGNRHQKLLVTAKQYPNSLRLVYLFGGTPDVCAKNMARWRGPDHDLLLKGHPAHAVTGRVVREFARAKYAATDAYTRLLPDMAESDMVPRYIPPQVPPYSVAWAKSGGDDAPWLPVYICDHNALDPSKHDLVNDRLMSIVKANPEHYRIAYFFGTRHLYEHILHVIQKTLMGGCCAFLKRDPRQRLLPYMAPTDMNLALPAPEKYAIPLNQMVWALSDAYPWLPAFVCDPEHLPCDFRTLGAYGDVVPALHKTRGSIKLWECSEYEALIKGHAESMVLADDAWDEFAKAMSNAADFMANDPADRVLPGFEPTNTSRTDEPDTIDLTSSPEAAPPSRRRREVASGKRHACRPRQDESAPSDRDDTATDQELEGELSVNSKAMRNKRSISQHGETKKAADDFKYNPTQRQVLQGLYMIEWHGLSCSVAIELKEEVAPDKIEGLLPLGRAKRHSGTSDATHENAVDNMQHSSDTSEIVETDPTFVKYDLEDDMQDLLTPVDPEPPVVRFLESGELPAIDSKSVIEGVPTDDDSPML
ncbi:hypothetical protein DYB28_003786, partial [Aphanomyces astaci]